MPDNSLELIKKRKKERTMLRQKTLMEGEMRGGSRADLVSREEEVDPHAVVSMGYIGVGRNYQSDNTLSAPTREKTKLELELEEKIEKITTLNDVKYS